MVGGLQRGLGLILGSVVSHPVAALGRRNVQKNVRREIANADLHPLSTALFFRPSRRDSALPPSRMGPCQMPPVRHSTFNLLLCPSPKFHHVVKQTSGSCCCGGFKVSASAEPTPHRGLSLHVAQIDAIGRPCMQHSASAAALYLAPPSRGGETTLDSPFATLRDRFYADRRKNYQQAEWIPHDKGPECYVGFP